LDKERQTAILIRKAAEMSYWWVKDWVRIESLREFIVTTEMKVLKFVPISIF
jgi:hypothetical protein